MEKKIRFLMGLWMSCCLLASEIQAQDGLLDQLVQEEMPGRQYAIGTFKGTRLINGQTIETRGEGNLDFIISHRFGRVNSGGYNFFGLDDANIRLGLDYSITDDFTVGIGRNSFQKVYDGFIKYRLVRQQTGEKRMPVSVTFFSDMSINTFKRPELPMTFERRLGYASQFLVARKFSEALSIQVMPSYLHQNLVPSAVEKNDLFAMGLGGRLKLTQRTSLNVEYYYRINTDDHDAYHNALAVGFDIETGGHVFQLQLTNAQSMTETGFIPFTTGNFWDGDIHVGFNISRSFQLKNKRER